MQQGAGAMNDDLDAIRQVLAADVESFRRLVEHYQRPLLTLIRNLARPIPTMRGRPGGVPGSIPIPGIVRPKAVGILDLRAGRQPEQFATVARSASWPLATCSVSTVQVLASRDVGPVRRSD